MARKLITLVAAFPTASLAATDKFPWPFHWPNHTTETTTTVPEPASRQFAGGFADGLGIGNDRSCFDDTKGAVDDLEPAVKDYLKGDIIDKGKALAKFGEGVKEIVLALGSCTKGVHGGLQYEELLKDLENPKYYSMHNAAVLSLQCLEDRKQLSAFANAWEKGHYHEAGYEIATTMLDVLENPGLPDTNGTASVDFANGLLKGFSGAIDNGCIKDASVEFGAVAGGITDLLTVVMIPEGLASLFQGLTGLVPLFKECMADKGEIMQLLKDMKDLRHPAELARDVGHNVQVNGIDIAAEAGSAWLDFKGQSWTRMGEDVGAILSKLFVPAPKTLIVV